MNAYTTELEARIEYALRRIEALEEEIETLADAVKRLGQTVNRALLKVDPGAVKRRVKKTKESG